MRNNSLSLSTLCLLGFVACQAPATQTPATQKPTTGTQSVDPNATICADEDVCDGRCVDKTLDPENCGACGNVCDDGELCKRGTCTAQGCARGVTQCQAECVDLQNDPANCGSCGKTCAKGEVCSKGACGSTCGVGVTKCGNKCIDTMNDPANCGGCGTTCAADQVCVKGMCGVSCGSGSEQCGNLCVDTQNDPTNCGACGEECWDDEVCVAGQCQTGCGPGTNACGSFFSCKDLQSDPDNCGACDNSCSAGEVCQAGACQTVCGGGSVKCGTKCVDTVSDSANCGGCGQVCANGTTCTAGTCTTLQCPTDSSWCSSGCVELQRNVNNCGSCGNACAAGQVCRNGACAACDSAVSDCDGDGWLVSEGDCCDKAGTCGAEPHKVNPGAIEVVGNGVDDNCNGQTDLFDAVDTIACDNNLKSNSVTANDYAKAIGICRTTVLNPATKQQKTWGLIEAKLLRADGTPLLAPTGPTGVTGASGASGASGATGPGLSQASIRANFGTGINPLDGSSMIVLSSGLAADSTQVGPGPNGGAPAGNPSEDMNSDVNIETCSNSLCIKDWFNASNPPLKATKALPVAPQCGSGTSGSPGTANDSVMLVLTLRAPTNAKAFSFNSFFFSAEYPTFVCSTYNDQFIALVDTPAGTPQPIANPIDKNLMTYSSGGQKWPIGINIAGGTDLFSVCRPNGGASDTCWEDSVSPQSCSLGETLLAGTGYEEDTFSGCNQGGATFWLTTAGNVIPGELVTIRIVIWDVGDNSYDSAALIDGFQWLSNATLPGTN